MKKIKKIVIASANSHKIKEFKTMLLGFEILSLKDIGFNEEIEESGSTFKENAKIKADAVCKFCAAKGMDVAVIADDSGLCVDALGGRPGVYSARFAGEHNDEANRQKLLQELHGKRDRTAHFECCLCLKIGEKEEYFVGKTFGKIAEQKLGSDAFGYDCLFLSDDLKKTFGEASEAEKDSVSHRGRALQQLLEFLKNR